MSEPAGKGRFHACVTDYSMKACGQTLRKKERKKEILTHEKYIPFYPDQFNDGTHPVCSE